MLLALVLTVCAALCTPPADELTALAFGGLSCANGATCSLASDGACHVTALTSDFTCNKNHVIASFSLPYLTTMNRAFNLNGNPSLQFVSLPRLTTALSHWQAESNAIMTSVNLSSLNFTQGFLRFSVVFGLLILFLPSLFSFYGNPTLPLINLPSLTATGDDLLIAKTPSLVGIFAPKLVVCGGALQISGNLTSLQFAAFPVLTSTCSRSWDEKNDISTTALFQMCPARISHGQCPPVNPVNFYCKQ